METKICFFTWEATWGKILMLDQLKRRGLTFANRCFLCKRWGETVDHLLLHCAKTRVFGSCFSLSLEFLGSFPPQFRAPLWVGEGLLLLRIGEELGQRDPLCLFWAVWKTGNDIVFKNKVFFLQKLKHFLCIFFERRPSCFLRMVP